MERLEQESAKILASQDVYNPITNKIHKIAGKPGGGNLSAAKKAQRIKKAAELLELPKAEAIEILANQEKIGDQSAKLYLEKASKAMYEQNMSAILDIKMQHFQMYMSQYEKADMTGKIEAAVKVLQAIEKLHGFHDSVVQNNIMIQNNLKVEQDYSNWSVEDLQILQELFKKYEVSSA